MRKVSHSLVSASLFLFLPAFLLLAVRTGELRDYIVAGGITAVILIFPLLCRAFGCDRLSGSLGLAVSLLCLLLLQAVDPSRILPQAIFLGLSLGAFFLFSWLTVQFPSRLIVGCFAGLLGLGCLALPRFASGLPEELESLGVPFLVLAVSCLLAARKRLVALVLGLAGCAGILLNMRIPGFYNATALPDGALSSALSALSGGRLFGTGLGLGTRFSDVSLSSASVPVFSLLCEQLGAIAACSLMVMYAVLVLRSVHIAACARNRFHGLAAMGAVLMLSLRALAASAEALGLVSLDGLPFPLLSTGLLPLASDWALLGIVSGAWHVHERDLEEDTRLAMLAR